MSTATARRPTGAHGACWAAVALAGAGLGLLVAAWWCWPVVIGAGILGVLQIRHDLTANRRADLSEEARIRIQEALKVTVGQSVRWHRHIPEKITLTLPAAALAGSQAHLAIAQAVERSWDPHHFTVTGTQVTRGRVTLRRTEPEPAAETTDLDCLKDRTRAVAEQLLGKDVTVDRYRIADDDQSLESFVIHHGYGARLANRSISRS